ncbi:MAG TPA: methyltransferase [Acidobacteriota bacterium]|nr:hypothetical protein [bacterium]HNX19257.1 methyltransferase [Acidobacteriota bacterium]
MAGRSKAEIARLVGLFLFLAGLLVLSKPTLVAVVVGAPIALLGEAVRCWAAGHLHKTEKLITSGPYRFTRNPLYLGRLLLLTGFGIAAWMPIRALGQDVPLNIMALFLGLLVFFGYYMPRKERIEPARLEALHGEEYRKYNAAVPALFPTFRPYADNGERWRGERFARNREGLTAVVIVLLVGFFLAKALLFPAAR